MSIKFSLVILLFVLFSFYSPPASASFLYGQPCSVRNTAFLYSITWIIPENQTNCIDITGYRFSLFEPSNHTGSFLRLVTDADTLYADRMQLELFPSHVVHVLPNLKTIDLSGNRLKKLPYKMHKIAPAVQKMLLANNMIYTPKKRPLFKSATLKMLMLSGNKLTAIYPITFAKMPNLEILYLDNNYLRHIDAKLFLPMRNLLYLHLGQNFIAKFPPSEVMPKMLRFYIKKNQRRLKRIPRLV